MLQAALVLMLLVLLPLQVIGVFFQIMQLMVKQLLAMHPQFALILKVLPLVVN
jgi:hypothetical protein